MTELPPNAGPVDTIAPGTRLREWEVISFRGRGSFGVVFEARRSSWLDEPPRALKVFDPIVSSAARTSLLGEFSALTDVEHPHLLAGIDAFDLDSAPHAGCVVFVLELADEDLASRVTRDGPLDAEVVAGIGADVADGLGALHEMGRVHGDVKPENILRVGDRWVLGDFGVTGVLEGSYAVTPGATIDYRPPELANAAPGSRLHRSTDVWALGVSLHVVGTGRHPFPGPDPLLRYAAVVRGDRATSPGLEPHLAEVVESSCLQPEPRDRADALVLRDRLRQVAASTDPAEPSANQGADASSPTVSPEPAGAADLLSAAPTVPESAQPTAPPVSVSTVPLLASESTVPLPPELTQPAAPLGPPTLPPPVGAAPVGVGKARVTSAAAAVVAAAVVCQLVALGAGALPFELETRRVVYVLVSLGVLGVGLEPAARVLQARLRPIALVPWRGLRPLVLAALAVTWLVATALLFGIAG